MHGVAVSLQSKSAEARTRWKERVETAARAALPEGSWTLQDRLSVTIYIFPAGELRGDIDNFVKPILDAMVGCVYGDDSQLEKLTVRKIEPDFVPRFTDPSPTLSDSLSMGMVEPMVYIRVDDDLDEELVW